MHAFIKRFSVGVFLLVVAYILARFFHWDVLHTIFIISVGSLVLALLASSEMFQDRIIDLPTGYRDFYQEADYERGQVAEVESTLYIVLNYFLPFYLVSVVIMFL